MELQTIINRRDFESHLAGRGLVLVDFYADWCGPCRMQGPILDEIGRESGDEVEIVKVNVDECPHLAQEYRIHGIPTLVLFMDGREVRHLAGLQSKAALLAEIKKYIN